MALSMIACSLMGCSCWPLGRADYGACPTRVPGIGPPRTAPGVAQTPPCATTDQAYASAMDLAEPVVSRDCRVGAGAAAALALAAMGDAATATAAARIARRQRA